MLPYIAAPWILWNMILTDFAVFLIYVCFHVDLTLCWKPNVPFRRSHFWWIDSASCSTSPSGRRAKSCPARVKYSDQAPQMIVSNKGGIIPKHVPVTVFPVEQVLLFLLFAQIWDFFWIQMNMGVLSMAWRNCLSPWPWLVRRRWVTHLFPAMVRFSHPIYGW